MPGGIPYIVGNEAAERFCYYGLRAILVIYMTKFLLGASGKVEPMTDEEAKVSYHLFVSAAYFFPLLGAIVSDALFGKYYTIISLSLVYCAGTAVLAMFGTKLGMNIGLLLIAIGSGGIKPCVSAHVGDQFGPANKHLLQRAFSWFYFSINFGSTFSIFLTPLLLNKWGPKVAFGVPSVLMLLATVVFWLGRHKFIHVPPAGKVFVREALSTDGLKLIARLSTLFIFVSIFWSLWDQSSSAWVLQAEHMDLNFFGYKLQPSQVQTANPVMIMLFIPIFSYYIYPAIDRVFPLTDLRKIGIGLWLTLASFLIPAWLETRIAAGAVPSVHWHMLAFALLTAGEVCVSITALELAYTQAPKSMKSLIMSLYLLAVSAGNAFTALVNKVIQDDKGVSRISGAQYYLFFAALMLVTAIIFAFVASAYKPQAIMQSAEAES